MAYRTKDISGELVNGIKALRRVPDKHGKARYVFECPRCSTEFECRLSDIKSGKTRSCGCLKGKPHGHFNSPTYMTWKAMRMRTKNPNHRSYHYYGGRGIECCERWDHFAHFLEDMGERPEGMTLDRIDVNGHYELSNCKWATPVEQANNKRKNLPEEIPQDDDLDKVLDTFLDCVVFS